jgi:hypothetical protein
MSDYCCKMLEKAIEEYDATFERPIYLTPEHEMRSDMLVLVLRKLTPGGNVSRTKRLVCFDYCPFCGKRLSREKEEEGNDG